MKAKLENTNFARKLRELRITKGLEVSEIVEKVGVTSTSYSIYENGRGLPTVKVLKKLAETFGVPYKELFDPWADSKGL
jgi:transcriptional regulator with XRE-family HTH domain